MKKKFSKLAVVYAAVFILINIFLLIGCGKTENTDAQTEQEAPFGISETEQDIIPASTDTEEQISVDTAQTQDDEKHVETGNIMRAYSDTEKERMQQLQQSYQKETAKPEKKIQEVDAAENVTEGTLCYIISTGEYYLPDRE
ncbi:MAG: hypothetical protein NC416_14230, partial [Eubacterium sp.]|nr:hypothetical protein [Eubacterium sp.]